MPFSFELNDRQAARVIEQAIRSGTPMRVDPDYAGPGEALPVQLIDEDRQYLTFRFEAADAPLAGRLIPSQYCQVQFSLGGAVYMLSVYVVDLNPPRGILRTSRPKMVQILERRKFVRTQLAARVPVIVRWLTRDRLAEASLFNIGGSGLAFKIGKDFADFILVGDMMEADFELPGLPVRFTFRISICNKTVASDNTSVIVGVQFQEGPEAAQGGSLDTLRRFLATQQQTTLSR